MDVMVRALGAEDTVRLIAVSGRELCEKARLIHGLSRVCTAALGRTLMASVMMGAQLKERNAKLTSIINGGGPAGKIVCTADNGGHVKGCVENPGLELPLTSGGKLDVAGAVGRSGELTVTRDLGLKEPYAGRCALASGEIAEDFAKYFLLSDQQPSMVYLGVRVDPGSGEVRAAGGLIAQPLPHCPDGVIDALQEKAGRVKTLTARLDEGGGLEDVLGSIFGDMGIRFTESLRPEFRCGCSRSRLERALISMGPEELEDMIEKEHGTELTCRFCNKKYSFTQADLEALLSEAGKA